MQATSIANERTINQISRNRGGRSLYMYFYAFPSKALYWTPCISFNDNRSGQADLESHKTYQPQTRPTLKLELPSVAPRWTCTEDR